MNEVLIHKVDRIHPYPAKFPIDLAMEYICRYTAEGDTVYDPFVGSGTTLLAASLLHRNGFGTDINHIGILITKAKLLCLSDQELERLDQFIDCFEESYEKRAETVTPRTYPSVEHWFCKNSIRVLSVILDETEQLETEAETVFVKLVTSSIINTVSNQESDTRYAAIEKPDLTVQKVGQIFIKKFRLTLALMRELNRLDRWADRSVPFLLDARDCGSVIQTGSVDLILTSPPYVNTYDYYLYHKHRMNWLGYDVMYSMESEIGSRREFSSLKHDESKFSQDLYSIFAACNDTLKQNGTVVLVIGDGKVAGELYDARQKMIQICAPLGWRLIEYASSNLDETSRSFQQAYRTKGKKEHIMVFRKEESA